MANTVEVTVKGIDKASKTFDKVSKKVDKAMESAEKSIEDVPDVDVDADVEDAIYSMERTEEKTDSLISKLRSVPNRITTRINLEVDEFHKSMDSLASKIRVVETLAGSMFKGGLISVIPMLVPMIASLTAGLGGLASAFASAGTGAIAFGAVAVSALNDVFEANKEINKLREKLANTEDMEKRKAILKEIEKAQSSLTKQQQRGLKAVQSFSKFWGKFSKQFQKPVMDVFVRSLEQLEGLIKSLKPTFKSSSKAFNSLSKSLDKAFKSEDVQNFIKFINDTAGPLIENFGKTFGNVLRGIMNLFVAFDDTGMKMSDRILELSEAFVDWSSKIEKSKGFQKFIGYVEKNGPMLMKFIGKLIMFVINLGIAMAPLGQKILELATKFLSWGSSMLENNKWIGQLIGYVTVFMGLFKALAPIIMVGVSLFTKVSSVIKFLIPFVKQAWLWIGTKVFLAFQKLWGVIARVIPWVMKIGGILKWFTGPVGLIINIVITLGIIIWKNWDKIKKWTMNVWNAIGTFLKVAWFLIKRKAVSVFTSIMTWIAKTWKNIKNTTTSLWNSITGAIGSSIDWAYNKVSNIFGSIESTITGVWDSIKKSTDSIWDGITGSIKSSINGVIGAINGMLNAISDISIDLPKVPSWVPGFGGSGGGSIGFPNIPNIPELATGGVVSKPTVAQVGDAGAGNPEIVAPQKIIAGIIARELGKYFGNIDFQGGSRQSVNLTLQMGNQDYQAFVDDIFKNGTAKLIPAMRRG